MDGNLIEIKWIQLQLQIKFYFVNNNYTKTKGTFVIIEEKENKTLNVYCN